MTDAVNPQITPSNIVRWNNNWHREISDQYRGPYQYLITATYAFAELPCAWLAAGWQNGTILPYPEDIPSAGDGYLTGLLLQPCQNSDDRSRIIIRTNHILLPSHEYGKAIHVGANKTLGNLIEKLEAVPPTSGDLSFHEWLYRQLKAAIAALFA